MLRIHLMPLVFASAGCATVGPVAGLPLRPIPAAYPLGCADVVEVRVVGRPELDQAAAVGLDGRLPLGLDPDPAAAGLTLAELRPAVAAAAGVDVNAVAVELAAPRAGRVYLVGPENRQMRPVPYVGPEPVTDFLARSGAVRPGCSELRHVTVLRPNVAAGGPPEAMTVDVEAVVRDGDRRTDVTLEPSDVVTVGETRRSCFSRQLPAWAQPAFRRLARVGGG